MWRWTKRTLVGIAMALICAALVGVLYQWASTRKELAATPPPGRLVAIEGHRLHLSCTGDGEPTVLLETGLGGSAADWGFVQPNVAQFTRVCSYDRAGMGYSDPGPSPRTAQRIARELAQLLDRSDIKGPLVLVAASIGAYPARVFASEYGDRVAALVLVDASHENQEHAIPDLARFVPVLSSIGILRLVGISFGPPTAALAPSTREFAEATRFRTAGQRATADEIVHVLESAAQVAATRRDLSIPVIVVTAGRGSDATWLDLQRDLVGLSRRGCQIITKQSGHAILLEEPTVVVNAIHTAVLAIRGPHDISAQCELRDGVPNKPLGSNEP
jgi:pimeloyl-ACP methyl ester carboxylesterase